jgi:hypothetical protein
MTYDHIGKKNLPKNSRISAFSGQYQVCPTKNLQRNHSYLLKFEKQMKRTTTPNTRTRHFSTPPNKFEGATRRSGLKAIYAQDDKGEIVLYLPQKNFRSVTRQMRGVYLLQAIPKLRPRFRGYCA